MYSQSRKETGEADFVDFERRPLACSKATQGSFQTTNSTMALDHFRASLFSFSARGLIVLFYSL
jgi:hypothetical protein